MNFSLLIPTRQRIPLLTELVKSIEHNTDGKTNMEVLLAYDTDDLPTARQCTWLSQSFPWVRHFGRKRSPRIVHDYLNWLFQFSTGKYIVVLNDDTYFPTPQWDMMVLAKLEAYLADKPDGIVYGSVDDSLQQGMHHRHEGLPYCCFPIVSRKAVEVLGYVQHPSFNSWGADIHLWKVFHDAGRILDLSCMKIDHISYHTGKRGRDETSYNMQRVAGNSGTGETWSETDKLLKHIQRSK